MDGRADIDMKIIDAFRYFANAPKNKWKGCVRHATFLSAPGLNSMQLNFITSEAGILSVNIFVTLTALRGSHGHRESSLNLVRNQLHPVPTFVRFPNSIIMLHQVFQVRSLLDVLPTIIIHPFPPPTSLLHLTAPV